MNAQIGLPTVLMEPFEIETVNVLLLLISFCSLHNKYEAIYPAKSYQLNIAIYIMDLWKIYTKEQQNGFKN
jgi:hypothetical protein